MDAEKHWVQQFHLGALRNVNSRARKTLGPDTGFDTMGDFEMTRPLSAFLDLLDRAKKLGRTIICSINPVACREEVQKTKSWKFQAPNTKSQTNTND